VLEVSLKKPCKTSSLAGEVLPPRAKLLRREIFVWTAAGPPLMNLRNSEALGQILRKTVSIFVDRKPL
jgi:hypothetical protein